MSLSLPTTVRPARVLRVLVTIVCVLLILSLIGQFSRFVLGHGRLMGFVEEFNVDLENNIPTYFSGLLLMSAALLSALVAWTRRRLDRPFGWYWTGLAMGFAYISIDEVAELHERTISPLRDALGADGLLYYTWVVPAAGILLLLGAVYLRFFWHLPRRWKGWFAAAGGTYLGGAVGVELLGGLYASQYGVDTFPYALITTVEEGLEMFGIVLFVYAVLAYLRADGIQFHVRLDDEGERPDPGDDEAGERKRRREIPTEHSGLAASRVRP